MRVQTKLTDAQQETLTRLREAIAGLGFGYYILPVVEQYRRSPLDFVAANKAGVQSVVAVLALPNGSISVRPWEWWDNHRQLKKRIEAVKATCPVRLWHRRFLPKGRAADWRNLLSAEVREEYDALSSTQPNKAA